MSYDNKLSLYYDRIYSDKNYEAECQMILRNTGHTDEFKLLDVGAGTCSHSIILSKYFKEITAVDISYSMLQIGKQKLINLFLRLLKKLATPVWTNSGVTDL